MPFTLTHVAAAVPIAWASRWSLPFSALAIGCMVCDLGVFYPTLFPYGTMHSVRGILTHCLPLGVSVHFVYQFILKEPLVGLMPPPVRRRLAPLAESRPGFTFGSVAAIALCIAAGAATHIFWDSFTHWGRWGVQQVPWLGEVAFTAGGRSIRWYAIAQHASSVVVLPPLVWAFFHWIFKQPVPVKADSKWRLGWPLVAAVALAVGLYAAWHFTGAYRRFAVTHGVVFVLRSTVRYTGALAMILLVLYGLVANWIWYRHGES